MSFASLKRLVAENQILVVLTGLIFGLLFPTHLRWLNQYSTYLLVIVFFTSSLRLSLSELVDYAKDWRMLFIVNLFMLVIIPLALYFPIHFFSPEWALAFLIMGAMPTGMTIALIADFFGGKTSLALVITATTSLLAPFTIPLIFKVAIGELIPIPILPMFWSLFVTIVIPFTLAMLVKRAIPNQIKKHDNIFREISVLAFGVLIMGIVADTSGATLISLTEREILIVVLGVIWLGILTLVSYDIVSWRSRAERVTIALCLIYLNNTLALFIADRFFKAQLIVPKLLFLLLIVNILLPPIKWLARTLTQKPSLSLT